MIVHSEHTENLPIKRNDDKDVECDEMSPSFASTGSLNWKFWRWFLQLPFMIMSTQEQQTTSIFRRGKCNEVFDKLELKIYFSQKERT